MDTASSSVDASDKDASTSSSPSSSACAVCSQTAHGIHFGVPSCRACAAFFRRTVVLDKKYSCRRVDASCDIEQDVRYLCRFCRFQKCLNVGMTPDNVQWNRDRLSNSTKLDEPRPSRSSSDSGKQTPPKSTEDLPKLPQQQDEKPLPPRFAMLISRMKSASYTLEMIFAQPVPEILTAFPLTALQRMTIATERHRGQIVENPQMLYTMTFDGMGNHWVTTLEKVANWMMHCEEFASLSLSDKILIFKHTCNNWARLEKVGLALTIFGEDCIRKRIFYYDGLVLGPHTSFEVEGVTQYSSEEITRFLQPNMERMFEDIAVPMFRANPAPIEFVYLQCATMWNIDGRGVSPEAQRVADSYRERISAELHDYYVHAQTMTNYAHRLIELHSILHNNEKVQHEKAELFLLFRLFNVFNYDLPGIDLLDPNKPWC